MKKLLLILTLTASTASIVAMEEAELKERKSIFRTQEKPEQKAVKIDPQTRYCLHYCATCTGLCCGLLQAALLLKVMNSNPACNKHC